eukprot:2109418-Prymnesium_polylepis.1
MSSADAAEPSRARASTTSTALVTTKLTALYLLRLELVAGCIRGRTGGGGWLSGSTRGGVLGLWPPPLYSSTLSTSCIHSHVD